MYTCLEHKGGTIHFLWFWVWIKHSVLESHNIKKMGIFIVIKQNSVFSYFKYQVEIWQVKSKTVWKPKNHDPLLYSSCSLNQCPWTSALIMTPSHRQALPHGISSQKGHWPSWGFEKWHHPLKYLGRTIRLEKSLRVQQLVLKMTKKSLFTFLSVIPEQPQQLTTCQCTHRVWSQHIPSSLCGKSCCTVNWNQEDCVMHPQ